MSWVRALPFIVVGACTATPTPEVVRAPIVGGYEEAGAEAVGMLRSIEPDGEDRFRCSGTLIAPQWVLTATHCIENFDSPAALEFVLGATRIPIDRLVPHPGYLQTVEHDVALMHLATPSDITPWAIARATVVEPGQGVQVTGFGLTSALLDDSGVKRSAWLQLHTVTRDWITNLWDGSSTCHGDSGGPMYVTIDGIPTIVGVTSHFGWSFAAGEGYDLADYCRNISLWTNVATEAAWLDAVMNDAPEDCRTMPSCTCDEACLPDGTCDASRCERSCHATLGCYFSCDTAACYRRCDAAASAIGLAQLEPVLACVHERCQPETSDWRECIYDACSDETLACTRETPRRAPDCAEILRCKEDCDSWHCQDVCEEGATPEVWVQQFGGSDCPAYFEEEPEPEPSPEPSPEAQPEAEPELQGRAHDRADDGCQGAPTALIGLVALSARRRRARP